VILFYHKAFTRLTIEQQNRFWGLHFGQKEIKITKIGAILAGAICIVLGLLSFSQMIHFK
jgi:hypothetical protein